MNRSFIQSALTAGLAAALPLGAQGLPATPPSHVVVVVMENHAYSQIIGSSSAPYINSLASGGASMTQSYGVSHPSEPNYMALFCGTTESLASDACPVSYFDDNLAQQLITANLSFAGYSEDLPSVGYTGCTSGAYARKHAPWVNFPNLPTSLNQPFTAFPTNFAQLPTISFVIPNLNDDMHDGTVSQGDTWLKTHLDAYAQWAKSNNSLLIVTWDEDDSSHGNQIATIFYGPMVKTGAYSEHINHYNVLRTLEALYGLPFDANAASATTIADIWQGSSNTVTATIGTPSTNVTVASGTSQSFAGSATDSSSTATLTYAWDFGDGGTATTASASHTYTNTGSSNVTYTAKFTATDNTGVSSSATRLITVSAAPQAPTITTQPASVTVTAPATATFSVAASGTAPFTYQWSKNGTAISGATAASYTTPATATTDSGSTFSVVVTNSAGSATSNNATLTVNAPAALAASVSAPSGNVTVASGAPVTFTGSATGGTTPYTYSWTFGDGGTATAASTSHTYTNTGTANVSYTATFKVTDNAGATSTVTRTITVTPAPVSTTFTEVESNNTIATANVVSPSYTAITGNLPTTTDVDYFALTLAPGQKITIAMTGPTGPDWDLYLKNSAGTTLASSTGSTTTENLSYTNTGSTSMTVYPEVIVYATASTSPYNLALTYSAVTPPNTVTASITTPSSDVTLASGTSQSFVGTATDSSSTATLTYSWNFGDGSTGSGASTSHTYTNTGSSNATYTATLTATDNTGVSNSTTRTITVTPAPTGSELILNGGFESGATSWSGTTGDIGSFTGEPAHAGSNDCWLDGNGSAATESIQQTITVPAAGANLTFWLHIDTAETTTTTAYDTLKVQVLNSAGTVLGTLATYSNLNKATGYSQKNLSLAAYAGQTVTIKFLGVEDSSLQTSFVLDDVSAK